MKSGCTPAAAVPAYLAIGWIPAAAAARSDISSRPAAPSFSGEELPPVTVPSGRKAGFLAARSSRVSSGLIPSSAVTSPPGALTGMISSARTPAAAAAAARWWLRRVNRSCRPRSTPYRSATFSAVSPRLTGG
jgi:hypothetical protein